MLKLKRTGPIWGLAGFILGALLSGATVGAIGYPGAHVPSPDTMQTNETRQDVSSPTILPQRIILSIVESDEIDAAINSLSNKEQRIIREDLSQKKYQLLWLTIWDWDTSEETGNTISIVSDEYRRIVTLRNRRTRTVIPEPKSGYIEFRGEATEDGNIAISLLSGTHPIALPRMPPGQIVKVTIDR